MKFCQLCDNMLYMKTEDKTQLMYYCKNCIFHDRGRRQPRATSDGHCVEPDVDGDPSLHRQEHQARRDAAAGPQYYMQEP